VFNLIRDQLVSRHRRAEFDEVYYKLDCRKRGKSMILLRTIWTVMKRVQVNLNIARVYNFKIKCLVRIRRLFDRFYLRANLYRGPQFYICQ